MDVKKNLQNKYNGNKTGIVKTENRIMQLQTQLDQLKKEKEKMLIEMKRVGYEVVNGDVTEIINCPDCY